LGLGKWSKNWSCYRRYAKLTSRGWKMLVPTGVSQQIQICTKFKRFRSKLHYVESLHVGCMLTFSDVSAAHLQPNFLTCTLNKTIPPPGTPRGCSYLPHQNSEEEDPPRRICTRCFKGGPLFPKMDIFHNWCTLNQADSLILLFLLLFHFVICAYNKVLSIYKLLSLLLDHIPNTYNIIKLYLLCVLLNIVRIRHLLQFEHVPMSRCLFMCTQCWSYTLYSKQINLT